MDLLKPKNYMKSIFFFVLALTAYASNSQNIYPSSGNVGIGTTSPSSNLSIFSASNPTISIESVGGGGNQSAIEFKPWNGRLGGASVKFVSIDDANYSAHFGLFTAPPGSSGNSIAEERMRITSSGNVGIGSTDPHTKFHIVGAHHTTQSRLTFPSYLNYGHSGDISLQTWVSEPWVSWDAGGIGMNVINDGGANGFGRLNGNIGQSFIRFIPNGGAMQFNTTANNGSHYANTLYMANGNVGIGTTNLTEKLSVNGNIRTKKIIVTQTGWPDYVFHSTYKLRSLSSLEAFTKKYGHLPDVPTAAEIEQNGNDVGATQVVLLRKIEELSLYIIQQGKELKNQSNKIAGQNKKIALLEKQIMGNGKNN